MSSGVERDVVVPREGVADDEASGSALACYGDKHGGWCLCVALQGYDIILVKVYGVAFLWRNKFFYGQSRVWRGAGGKHWGCGFRIGV